MKIAIGFAARFALALLGCVAMQPAAHARDGVIEINQAMIDANPAAAVINQSGSYRLTSNLTQPTNDTDVIRIDANNVTLDLNGFAIIGANQCTYSSVPNPSVSCSGNGTGFGITGAVRGVTVKNGSIKGMGSACVYLNGSNNRLEDLHLSHCGSFGGRIVGGVVSRVSSSYNSAFGLDVGSVAVTDSTATYNGSNGINTYGTVRNSVASRNVGSGISCGTCVATGNAAYDNGVFGIYVGNGSAIGNIAYSNANVGLSAGGSTTYRDNLLMANNGGGLQVGSALGVFLLNAGGNVCGTAACP
jgi:hypothetical protein